MTEDRKPVTGKSAEDSLYALPYVLGKMRGAEMIGWHLVENDKKFNETKEFSNEFLEFIKAATRSINYLSGFYDAIEEVFGKGYGKEMFERVIGAHTNAKPTGSCETKSAFCGNTSRTPKTMRQRWHERQPITTIISPHPSCET